MINTYCFTFLAGLCFIVQLLLLSWDQCFIAPIIPMTVFAGLLLYRSPEIGLLCLAFIIPFEGIFSKAPSFTGAKLIGLSLILICTVKIITRQISLNNLRTRLNVPIFFLLFFFYLSSVFTQYNGFSYDTMRQLLTGVIIFFITLLLGDRINFRQLARIIVTSVAITAVIAILSIGDSSVEGRAIGLLTDPNVFALLLVNAIPLSIYLILFEPGKIRKIFWGLLFLVMLIAFQKTMSRSGLLVLLFLFFLLAVNYKYLLKKLPLSRIFLGVTFTLVLLILGTVFLPGEYRDRILTLSSLGAGSTSSIGDISLGRRTSYIIVGWETLKEAPILGSGPGTFPIKYAQSGYASAFSPEGDDMDIFRRAHNTYLETVTETGLLGLLALLALLAVGSYQFLQARRLELRRGRLQNAHLITHFVISLAGILIFLIFLSELTNKYLWMYLATGSVMYKLARKDTPIS